MVSGVTPKLVIRYARWRALVLAVICGGLFAGSVFAAVQADANGVDRFAGAASALIFGWGVWMSGTRAFDRRPVIEIDAAGVRDRRMRIDAPWPAIRAIWIWRQELDAAKVDWIALDVGDVDAVRRLSPLWAVLRRRTLEALGRPAVALNLMGLEFDGAVILAAIAAQHPELVTPGRDRPASGRS